MLDYWLLSGRFLASLPCDVYIGKFIVLGYLFSVLAEAVIIAAGLITNGSIFRFDYKRLMESYRTRLSFSDGSGSDLQAILNAYQQWQSNHRNKKFEEKGSEEMWLQEKQLDRNHLCEMKELIKEIMDRLERLHIKVTADEESPPINEDHEKPMILKLCTAGAFLPYYYLHEPTDDTTERVAYQTIDAMDVNNTVYFKNDILYNRFYNDILRRALVNARICENINDTEIIYNDNHTKIFVRFSRKETISTTRGVMALDSLIAPEVYLSIKYRQISRSPFKIHVIDRRSMIRFAKQIGFEEEANDASMNSSSLTLEHSMKGFVTHIVDCRKFFFQPQGQPNYQQKLMLARIETMMKKLNPVESDLQLTNNDKVIISYRDSFQRAIAIKSVSHPLQFHLIDLGIVTSDIDISTVYRCPEKMLSGSDNIFEIPQLCIECSLSNITAYFLRSPQGLWSIESTNYFRKLVENKEVEIEIYSVVDDVASVTVYVKEYESVNLKMIEEKFALQCDESFSSRLNHEEREKSSIYTTLNTSMTSEIYKASENASVNRSKLLLLPKGMSDNMLHLSGPHSPLESKLSGVTHLDSLSIKIDPVSVNSVILNGDINRPCSRFYVAASVTKNQHNKEQGMTLRNVTMMPSIPGLAEMMALVFCPRASISRDMENTRHNVIQTGLGCDKITKEALFPVNDAYLPVNVELDEEDFKKINRLRKLMSELLFTSPDNDFPDLLSREKYERLKEIKEMILK